MNPPRQLTSRPNVGRNYCAGDIFFNQKLAGVNSFSYLCCIKISSQKNFCNMATQFINLTPHAITIVDTRSDDESNIIRQIPPSGWELRVSEKTENIGEVDRIPLTKKTFGKLEVVKGRNGEGTAPQMDIPDTIYIMSQMAKAALDKAKISDIDFQVDYQNCLYAVPTDMLRDENGGIIGCRSLGV